MKSEPEAADLETRVVESIDEGGLNLSAFVDQLVEYLRDVAIAMVAGPESELIKT